MMAKAPQPVSRDRGGRFAPGANSSPEVNLKDYRLPNPEWNQAMQGKGSSNATQPHDSRPHRQRSRADSRRAAIRDH